MSKLFEESEHKYTKTYYTITPYKKEIIEKVTKVVGRKCDRCDHIFKDTEIYFFFDQSQEYEEKSIDADYCVKCIDTEFNKFAHLQYDYDSVFIGKRINYIK